MTIFEAIMLICFGISWPISIAKAIRTRQVAGKSPLFMAIVFIGYLSGVTCKITGTMDWVTALYTLNAVMVAVDLTLYYRYLPRVKGVSA
jgi:hypothetical protein